MFFIRFHSFRIFSSLLYPEFHILLIWSGSPQQLFLCRGRAEYSLVLCLHMIKRNIERGWQIGSNFVVEVESFCGSSRFRKETYPKWMNLGILYVFNKILIYLMIVIFIILIGY